MDGAGAVAEGGRGAAGAEGDDLRRDRDGGLLGGAGSEVETDRSVIRARSASIADTPSRSVEPPSACGASPWRPGSRRRSSGGQSAGTSNLRVVGEHADGVARAEVGIDRVEVAVGPVDDHLVGLGNRGAVAKTSRASHTVTW